MFSEFSDSIANISGLSDLKNSSVIVHFSDLKHGVYVCRVVWFHPNTMCTSDHIFLCWLTRPCKQAHLCHIPSLSRVLERHVVSIYSYPSFLDSPTDLDQDQARLRNCYFGWYKRGIEDQRICCSHWPRLPDQSSVWFYLWCHFFHNREHTYNWI